MVLLIHICESYSAEKLLGLGSALDNRAALAAMCYKTMSAAFERTGFPLVMTALFCGTASLGDALAFRTRSLQATRACLLYNCVDLRALHVVLLSAR